MKTTFRLLLITLLFKANFTVAVAVSLATTSASYKASDLTGPFTGWGVNPENKASINLLPAWHIFKKNVDVTVAIVDSGIDVEHPFLEKNIYTSNKILATKNNFGADFSKDRQSENTPTDYHGHGTHVAGIIKSIFPEVHILPIKYFNDKAKGSENLKATIEALRYAVNSNVDIINYSSGGPGADRDEFEILKEAERKGIIVVAASGNLESNIDDSKKAYYPASYGLKNIITVTAHDEDLKILNSSNYGQKSVDIAAPGFRIRSASNGKTAQFLTGTSQGTAFVGGVVALIKANYPELSAAEIKDIIIKSAKKEIFLEGKCIAGGRLDAANALKVASAVAIAKANNSRVTAATTSNKNARVQ